MKDNIIKNVIPELNKFGFSGNYPKYYRRSEKYIEIIEFGKDKYEPAIRVAASLVYLKEANENSNVDFRVFNAYSEGKIENISVYDCIDKYFVKGNFGLNFYYCDVYLVLGRGIIGVSPKSKRPFGIRLKKFTEKTYNEITSLMCKRIAEIMKWLEKKKAVRS